MGSSADADAAANGAVGMGRRGPAFPAVFPAEFFRTELQQSAGSARRQLEQFGPILAQMLGHAVDIVVDTALEIVAAVLHPQLVPRDDLVLDAEIDRIHADLFGKPVGAALHACAQRAVAHAAHATRSKHVGVDAVDFVVAVSVLAPHIDAEEAHIVLEAVPAVVDQMIEFKEGQRSVRLAAHRAARALLMAAFDGDHALFVVQFNLDRTMHFLGQQHCDDHEVVGPPLAERTAARKRLDANVRQRNSKSLVDAVAQFARCLRRGDDIHLVAHPFRDASIAAQRRILLAFIEDVALDRLIGLRPAG